MDSLSRDSALYKRYVSQLDAQETELAGFLTEIDRLAKKEMEQRKALEELHPVDRREVKTAPAGRGPSRVARLLSAACRRVPLAAYSLPEKRGYLSVKNPRYRLMRYTQR